MSFILRIFLRVLNYVLYLFGYKISSLPHSEQRSAVYLLFNFKKRLASNNLIEKCDYFGFDVYYQSSDFRAYFHPRWDEESSRIYAIYESSKVFDNFDWYDVGANYGTYSLPFIVDDRASSVVLVEANPFLTSCLRKTFAKSNVVILEAAVTGGDEPENSFFNITPYSSGGSSLKKNSSVKNPLRGFGLEVQSIGFRTIFEQNRKAGVAVVKFDIEGSEIDLLRAGLCGHEGLLGFYDEFVVVLEFIPEILSGEDVDTLCEALEEFYCIPLSNNRFKSKHGVRYCKKFKISNTDDGVSAFYDLECRKGVRYLLVEADFKYADVLVFSSKTIAAKVAERFGIGFK